MRSSTRHVVGIEATGPNSSLPVGQHRDPADRIGPIGHRHRQIGEHPTRRMHRQPPIRVQQRLGDPVDQPGVLGHLPQQTGPGVRHHALPVRADLDPPATLATLHPSSACSVSSLDFRKPKFPLQDRHFHAHQARVSQPRVGSGAGAVAQCLRPVSSPRPSNRACGSPAHGSPTSFTAGIRRDPPGPEGSGCGDGSCQVDQAQVVRGGEGHHVPPEGAASGGVVC